MKKFSILTVLALAMVLAFTSCGFNAGMQTLDKDEITADWVDGYWSGTVITTVDDGDSNTANWEHEYFTATALKALFDAKGSVSIGDNGIKVKCVVQANMARSKIYVKQTSTVTLLGNSTTTVIEYQLTRDKNQSK